MNYTFKLLLHCFKTQVTRPQVQSWITLLDTRQSTDVMWQHTTWSGHFIAPSRWRSYQTQITKLPEKIWLHCSFYASVWGWRGQPDLKLNDPWMALKGPQAWKNGEKTPKKHSMVIWFQDPVTKPVLPIRMWPFIFCMRHINEATDHWIMSRTFKISNSAHSLLSRDISCKQMRQPALLEHWIRLRSWPTPPVHTVHDNLFSGLKPEA